MRFLMSVRQHLADSGMVAGRDAGPTASPVGPASVPVTLIGQPRHPTEGERHSPLHKPQEG